MTKQIRHFGFTINLHLACYRTNKAASLLLFKKERRDVGEVLTGASFVCRVCSTTINKGKFLVGILLGYCINRILHQESYTNDHISLLCSRGDVFGVFGIADLCRLNDHIWETVLCSSLFVALVGKLVES